MEKKETGPQKKTGYLIKQGRFIKTWKKRYFVMQNYTLTYYKAPGENALGSIPLDGTVLVRLEKDDLISVTTYDRTLLLQGEVEEISGWLTAMKESVTQWRKDMAKKFINLQIEKERNGLTYEEWVLQPPKPATEGEGAYLAMPSLPATAFEGRGKHKSADVLPHYLSIPKGASSSQNGDNRPKSAYGGLPTYDRNLVEEEEEKEKFFDDEAVSEARKRYDGLPIAKLE